MKTTINQRISELIPRVAKNSSDFAKKLNLPPSTVSSIVNNNSKPGADILEKIGDGFRQINSDWLLYGHGQMLKTETKEDISLVDILKKQNEILAKNNEELLKTQERLWNIIESNGKKDKPTPSSPSTTKGKIILLFPEFEEKMLATN